MARRFGVQSVSRNIINVLTRFGHVNLLTHNADAGILEFISNNMNKIYLFAYIFFFDTFKLDGKSVYWKPSVFLGRSVCIMHVNGSLSLVVVIVFRRVAVGTLGFLVLLCIYLLTAIQVGLVGSWSMISVRANVV